MGNESCNCGCGYDIEGGGIGDYISNIFTNKVSADVVKKVREYGKLNVTGFTIHRSPVQKVLQKILKGISFGKFNPGSVGFDDVYHLFIVFRLGTPLYPNYVHYILSEKRPVLIMENRKDFASKTSKGDFIIDTHLPEPHITFEEMIMKTMNIMGSKFTTYDPVNNNCQTIIKAFVNSLGVYKYDDYIEQDVSSILTGATHKIARGITDIGHAFGRVFGGDLFDIDMGLSGGREIQIGDTPKTAEAIDEIPFWKPEAWHYESVNKEIEDIRKGIPIRKRNIPNSVNLEDPTSYVDLTQRRDPHPRNYFRTSFIFNDGKFNFDPTDPNSGLDIVNKVANDVDKFFNREGIIAPYWYNRSTESRYYRNMGAPERNNPFEGKVGDIIDERAGSYNNPYVSVSPDIDVALKFLFMALALFTNTNAGYLFIIRSNRGIPITYTGDRDRYNRHDYNDNFEHVDFNEYVIPGEVTIKEMMDVIPILFNPYSGDHDIGFYVFEYKKPVPPIVSEAIDRINAIIRSRIQDTSDIVYHYYRKIRALVNISKNGISSNRYHVIVNDQDVDDSASIPY